MSTAIAKRILTGAALRSRIEKQLREHYLAGFGLPLHLYGCHVERNGWIEGPYYDGGPTRWMPSATHSATFTHRGTAAQVVVGEIWTDDDGEIMQVGSNYGALTY